MPSSEITFVEEQHHSKYFIYMMTIILYQKIKNIFFVVFIIYILWYLKIYHRQNKRTGQEGKNKKVVKKEGAPMNT